MLLGEAVKVKPKCQWRTQDTGDARTRMSESHRELSTEHKAKERGRVCFRNRIKEVRLPTSLGAQLDFYHKSQVPDMNLQDVVFFLLYFHPIILCYVLIFLSGISLSFTL